MSTETTTDPAILEELLATELFGGLNKITDEEIGWAKVQMAKALNGAGRIGKGKATGSLNRSEQALLTLSFKLREAAEKIAREEEQKASALDGTRPDDAEMERAIGNAKRGLRFKEQAELLAKLAFSLVQERLHDQIAGHEVCQVWVDEDLSLRTSTHKEEHDGFGGRILVVSGQGLEGLFEILGRRGFRH